MTEAEKDSWIVQLRRDVVKYMEAYRLTKYQLDSALNEIIGLKEKNEMKLSIGDVKEIVNKVTNGGGVITRHSKRNSQGCA